MQDSVKENRSAYIGGSDIAVILGISPFKTRWQLLREKAGLEKDTFEGNQYTAYGNAMEGKIRDYINEITERNFVEGKFIIEAEGDEPIGIRCHTDGEDATTILEIKTTSDIEGNIDMYKAKLCFYMMMEGKNQGLLACYIRPDDMSEEFDPARLHRNLYTLGEFYETGLVTAIEKAVDHFMADLKALNDNPFLSEQDLMPDELIEVANQVILFEKRLAQLKEEEKAIKAEKQKLFDAMLSSNVKKWETLNGYLITRVDAIPEGEKEVEEFCEEKFAEEHPKMYKKYTQKLTIKTSGRAGYVKVTPPKGVK